MRELSYDEVVNIQNNIYRKLINYVNEYLDDDNNIESIEFHYPDFNDDKASKAFDTWLIMDFKTKYNKTFITHMLEDSNSSFSFLEKKVLENIKNVYLSLYEVIRIKNDYIEVYDLLNNEKHKLLDPKSIDIVKKGDIVFGRVGKVLEYKVFIGNISFLPTSAKSRFISRFFVNYNKVNLKKQYINIKEYSKENSLVLYKIYTDIVYDLIKSDEDITSKLYDELDSFKDYMDNYLRRDELDEIMGNLMNFFEFYLIQSDLTLKDINKIDFEVLAKNAIEDNYINTREDFLSYINTFKNYLKFLKGKDKKYKLAYDEVLKLSERRFIYFDLINQSDNAFKINKKISHGVYKNFNERIFSTIIDYERFLLNIINDPINIDKENNITLDELMEINSLMDNQVELDVNITKKSFIMLELFYKFSLNIGVAEIKNGFLKITKKGNQFIRLSDEDKFSILFNYIWDKEFLISISDDFNLSEYENLLFLDLLNNSKDKEINIYEHFLNNDNNFKEIINKYCDYLEIIGFIKYNEDKTLRFTQFGKLVLELNLSNNNINVLGKVIKIR